MKINSLTLPEDFFGKGLGNIRIDRLNDIVILAGKNGAGKTRLLEIVFECMNSYIMTEKEKVKLSEDIGIYETAIKDRPTSSDYDTWEKTLLQLNERKLIDSYFCLDKRCLNTLP